MNLNEHGTPAWRPVESPSAPPPRGWPTRLAATTLVAGMLFGSYYLGTHQGDVAGALQMPTAPITLAAESGNSRVEKERGLFAELAKRLNPTVVHLQVTVRQAAGELPQVPGHFPGFFGPGMPTPPREGRGQGSGVIVSQDGYILTNHHVVKGATEIKVTLADNRELKGRIVGSDPKTDIAVIKVESPTPLQAAELGNSDGAEIGDWVMAIGNPFGLSHTVTVGVISGKGRVIGLGEYDQFLQTDASINPGNSGGPLFDTEGRVIGINTAIIHDGQGIGFAVPVNLARQVADQLRDNGEVVRGFVGLGIQPVDAKMIQALDLPEGTAGALVSSLVAGGPGEKAGVQVGDVVVEFNGKKLADEREFLNAVAATPVGSQATLTVLRDGRTQKLDLTVARRPSEERPLGAAPEEAPDSGRIGVAVRDLTPEIAGQLGVRFSEGAVITSVQPGSVAEESGLRQGDVIRRVGATTVKNARDFAQAVKGHENEPLALLVVREGNQMFLLLEGDAG